MACTPIVAQRGRVIEAEDVQALKVNQTREPEVKLRLGTPSMTSMFADSHTWYYVSEITETKAFFRPRIMERQVYVLRFDNDGLLTAMNELQARDGQPIHFAKEETPTAGEELTVVQQLIGNVGKFNNAGTGAGGIPGSAPGQ